MRKKLRPHVIKLSRRDIAPLKRRAKHLAQTRCTQLAGAYGVRLGRVSIGAARTRWGSCSHRGALRFNYRIAALPAHLAEYIIVHEICHLAEFNHSPKFWALVARAAPDHAARRAQLRRIAFSFR